VVACPSDHALNAHAMDAGYASSVWNIRKYTSIRHPGQLLYQIVAPPLVPLIPPPVPLVPDRSRFIFESGTPVTA